MIKNDAHLKAAQEAVRNLQQVLLAARKVHRAAENRTMSEPILLEVRQREQEILEYLSHTEAEASLTCRYADRSTRHIGGNLRMRSSRT